MNNQIVNLHLFQEEFFRSAIRRVVEENYAHYGDRLVSFYVEGSVHRNEAIPAISDVDHYIFIDGEPGESDRGWQRQAQAKLRQDILGFHVLSSPVSVQTAFPSGQAVDEEQEQTVFEWMLLKRWYWNNPTDDPAEIEHRQSVISNEEMKNKSEMLAFGARARELRYDATLVYGRDLTEGMSIPPWNRKWAQCYGAYYFLPREVVRHAAGLEPENATVFKLPDAPPLRLRKLARLGVLIAAAALMGSDEFKSFKSLDVLPPLRERYPDWGDFLAETGRLSIQMVVPSNAQMDDYIASLVRWVDFVGEQLQDE